MRDMRVRGASIAAGLGRYPSRKCCVMSKTDQAPRRAMLEAMKRRTLRNKDNETMPDVTIIYWRDMPAQVMVGRGRKASKIQLPERFEQAIDRAAMKSGAAGTDEYLSGMRRGDPYALDGEDAAVAQAEAARLDAEFTPDRLRALIENDGWM